VTLIEYLQTFAVSVTFFILITTTLVLNSTFPREKGQKLPPWRILVIASLVAVTVVFILQMRVMVTASA